MKSVKHASVTLARRFRLDHAAYEREFSQCVSEYLRPDVSNAERSAILARSEGLRTRFAAAFGAAEERQLWTRLVERNAAIPVRASA